MRYGSEDSRALVHAAAGLPAILLPFISHEVALVTASLAIAFNAIVLPRTPLGRRWKEHRSLMGVILYPVTVLALLLYFGDQYLPVVAGWGVLAFGDSAASVIGRRWPLRPLPYGDGKSIGGVCAFMAGAWVGCFVLANHIGIGDLQTAAIFAFFAAGLGAFVESLPIPVNDNLTAPLAAAALISLMGF